MIKCLKTLASLSIALSISEAFFVSGERERNPINENWLYFKSLTSAFTLSFYKLLCTWKCRWKEKKKKEKKMKKRKCRWKPEAIRSPRAKGWGNSGSPVGIRNQPWVLCKTNTCSWLQKHLSPPNLLYAFIICMCAICVKVRRQHAGLSSLLPPCGSQWTDPGCQPRQGLFSIDQSCLAFLKNSY